MRAGIRREHVGSSTHTVHTHTHGGDSDKEKKYTHKQEWNGDAKRKKVNKLRIPLLSPLRLCKLNEPLFAYA